MKPAWLLAPLVLLTGCGLRPLYAGGSNGAVATALTGVTIAPIEGKAGWLVRNALADRIMPSGAARYRLEVELDDKISGLGVRRDDAVTRERRTLRARFRLIDIGSAAIVLDATAGSDEGIDVVSSDYGTIAAENTALERLSASLGDQISARVALFVRDTTPPVAAATP